MHLTVNSTIPAMCATPRDHAFESSLSCVSVLAEEEWWKYCDQYFTPNSLLHNLSYQKVSRHC